MTITDDILRNGIATLILLVAVIVLRWLVARAVGRSGLLAENRLRLESQLRALAVALFVFGGIAIWAEELGSVLLSLVAVGAAIAIITKEVFASLIGTLVRSSVGGYVIGDRIEVAGVRGDVVDISLLATKILEVGPSSGSPIRSGRLIVLPNSLVLTSPIINETRGLSWAQHTLRVVVPHGADFETHESALLEAARMAVAPLVGEGREAFQSAEVRYGNGTHATEPRVVLVLEGETRALILRYAAPNRARVATEQKILRAYIREIEGRTGARDAHPLPPVAVPAPPPVNV